MESNESGPRLGRRRFLQTTAVLAGGGAVAGAARPAAGETADLAAWFENVSNYEGIVDARGQSDVTVTVGASGNGGSFAFEPAAVRVDPGTTITWEWTGEGGQHDVAAEDDAYGSDLLGNAGDTFEHTFEDGGVSRYACTPHKTMGMKGAVIVGDVETDIETAAPPLVDREPDYGDWFANTDFEGTVDMRGREEVRITVTEDGTFDPPAVHVDPGTAVIWEWDGEAVGIEAVDGSFASPEQSGGQWGLRFDGVGISKYVSTADGDVHGAIVVGNVFEGIYDVSTTQLVIAGSLGAALLSPLAFGVFLWTRSNISRPTGGETSGQSTAPKRDPDP